MLKVTELVSELKFKHHSEPLFPLHHSDRQAPESEQHPFTPQHPRAHKTRADLCMPPGVPRRLRFTEAFVTKLTNVLVSDLTTKSSARQGRPRLQEPQREGRELARTWLCGRAPASAVASRPGVIPYGARWAPPSRCGQLRSPAARRVPVLRGAFRSARRSRTPLPAPALRALHAATPQSSPGSPAGTRPAGSWRLARLPAWAPGTRSGLAMAVAARGGARLLPAPSHLGRPGEAGRQVSAARGGAARVTAWGRRLGPVPGGTKPNGRE